MFGVEPVYGERKNGKDHITLTYDNKRWENLYENQMGTKKQK